MTCKADQQTGQAVSSMGLYLITTSVLLAVVLPALVLTCQLPACQIHVNLSSSQQCTGCSGKAIECITDPKKSIVIDINQLNKTLASTDSEDQLPIENKCWLLLSVYDLKEVRLGLLGKIDNLQRENLSSNEPSMHQFNFINSDENVTIPGVSMNQFDMLVKVLRNLSLNSNSHQYLYLDSNQINCSQGIVTFACEEHSSRAFNNVMLNMDCRCISINVVPIVLPLMAILLLVAVALGTWWHFRTRCSSFRLTNYWRTSRNLQVVHSNAFANEKALASDNEYHQLQLKNFKPSNEMFKLQCHQTSLDNESTVDQDIYVNFWEQNTNALQQQEHEILQDEEQVYMNQEYNLQPPMVDDVYEMPDVK